MDPGSSVYYTYRVPNPGAPYPQDYIIDQNGNIAYWSDEYDPQRIVAVIDELLETGFEEEESPGTGADLELSIVPNPANSSVTITAGGFPEGATLSVFSMAGRLIESRALEQPSSVDLDLDHPAGLYLIFLRALGQSATRALTLLP